VTSACGEVLTPSAPVITNNPNPLACEGTRTYAYTYTDCEGNTAVWSFVYTIEREPFTVPANGSATVACPALAVAPTPPTVTSACGEVLTPSAPVITNNPNPLACEGARTYAYTYTDCEGNTAVWSFVYTIERLPFTVPANGAATVACPALANVQPTPPTVTSNCGEVLTPVVTSSQALGCEGNRVWYFAYTDCEGNTATWLFTYTVEYADFSVPPNVVQNFGCPINEGTPTPPSVQDNCGNLLSPTGPSITSTYNAQGCEASRTYAWTYRDCEGNTHVWSTTHNFIYVGDFFPPQDEVNFVGCLSHAVPPVPQTLYDICGRPISVSGPEVKELPGETPCSGTIIYTFVYTDCGGHSHPWTFTVHAADNEPPIGKCTGLVIDGLSCAEEVPCPDSDFSAAIEQLLKEGEFYDLCSGDDLVVTLDSWTEFSACNDDDGDGQYTFGRTFYFRIGDACGNKFPELCPVTYSGECLPIGTLPPDAWSQHGNGEGTTVDPAITQQLLDTYGPLVIGGGNASLTVKDANCLIKLMPGKGYPGPLEKCHQVDCEPGCNPSSEMGLENTLATSAMAVHLSLWTSAYQNGLEPGHLAAQGLGCLQLDPGLVLCKEVDCVLRVFDQNGIEHTYPYTVAGLLELVDDFLGREIGTGFGEGGVYATELEKALQELLAYYGEGGTAGTGGCGSGARAPEPGSEKAWQAGSAKAASPAGFTLAPNPTDRLVSLRLSGVEGAQEVSLEVYNGQGQLVLRKEFGRVSGLDEQLDLSGLSSGVYLVTVRSGGERFSRRLVVAKG
jgi:hypothetical protein